MNDQERVKAEIAELKELYRELRTRSSSIEKLVNRTVDREIDVDFWELSGAEIVNEMWNRLAVLDADADCLPAGPIRSHRRLLGWPIAFGKRILRALTMPYSRMLLEKQNRLNRELVNFHLLTFLKLRDLEKRIRELEMTGSELGSWQAKPRPAAKKRPRKK